MATFLGQLESATRRTVEAAGPRYSPAVDPTAPNVEIADLVDAVSALVLGSRARTRMREHATTLRQVSKKTEITLSRCFAGVQTKPEVVADDLYRLAEMASAREVRLGLATLRRHLHLARRCAERRQEAAEVELSRLRDSASDQLDEAEKRQREVLQYRARDLRDVWYSLSEVEQWAAGAEGQLLADRPCALLLGPWGSGKTHFVCDFALAAAADGVPAVAVLASSLRDDLEPLDAISLATGIGRDGADLAAKLDRAAKRAGRRALIAIDAINEADRAAWRRRLPGLARSVAQYDHLGLLLTCRTPFDQTTVSKAAGSRLVVLHHRGFEDQEFDAQQEFFEHYGLPAPHVPLITPEFSRPLFLRLLCEAVARLSRSSQHRQLNDIASGQKGMTYVLEYFTRSVGARVEQAHTLPALTCWKVMKGLPSRSHLGLAGRMASDGQNLLVPAAVEDELKAQTGLPADRARAVAADMVSEGLLAEDVRYLGGRYEHVLTFPYQRFADHLIARHLLDRHLDTRSEAAVRRSFYANRPLGALFNLEGWSRQYAEPGLASAIMLEFPERVKRLGLRSELILYLPQKRRLVEPFVRTFLDGLYWRSAPSFTEDTNRIIDRLLDLDTPWITTELFETLTGLAARPSHPLNAESLWQRLTAMAMSKRDLVWSEGLRTSEPTSSIHRLLAWAERPSRPTASERVVLNEMRVLALGLTTSDRVLRDRCTRALVQLGEAHPKPLFELTVESLSFNDPYVSERMLAASYGVCMRRWAIESSDSVLAKGAVDLAHQLVDQLLRPSGHHFTWHTLARGYATGIVELARRMRPRNIPPGVLGGLVPDPTKAPSPFRAPRRIRAEDTTDGDHAIHLDFGNYTMGRLVTGRRNYDMEHVEYGRLRRQIEDRIRRLGYSWELFSEIDRRIGHSSWREERGGKTDRYGKKYSWIAYFEMYGLREALGLLDDDWHPNERTSDCDVDPSFPDTVPTWAAPVEDIFNESPADHLEWLEHGRAPDHRDLLDRPDVDGIVGDWVLLDAVIRANGSNGREVVTYVASVMASASNSRRLRDEFTSGRGFGSHGVPESGTDYYTYFGEVPWSLRFGSDVRAASGVPKHMLQRAFDYYANGRWRSGIAVEAATRTWAWESYHSELNQTGSVEVPAPPLADFLGLQSVNASADLIDPAGQIGTIYRESPGNGLGSHYLYIRRDLLDGYLARRKLQLVRAVWGERTLHYDLFKEDISDELRQPLIRRANTFRFADLAGEWLSLVAEQP